jgi:hypothetical protein
VLAFILKYFFYRINKILKIKMSQHTGIAESRRVNKHLYETICSENNNYKFECVCIQRCSETKNNNHFYYLGLILIAFTILAILKFFFHK